MTNSQIKLLAFRIGKISFFIVVAFFVYMSYSFQNIEALINSILAVPIAWLVVLAMYAVLRVYNLIVHGKLVVEEQR